MVLLLLKVLLDGECVVNEFMVLMVEVMMLILFGDV